jgi:hypothetical protein
MRRQKLKRNANSTQNHFALAAHVILSGGPMKLAWNIISVGIISVGIAAGVLMLGIASSSAEDVAKIQTPPWPAEKWPFPIDQWGIGQAFGCAAERCGREVHLYLRAKIGFCRCATGVSDDDEIERVGDLELIGADYRALASGHPVTAGIMTGRARLFAVARPLQSAVPVLAIALANKCDAIVATVMAEPEAQSDVETQALDFLRSAAVQHSADAQRESD